VLVGFTQMGLQQCKIEKVKEGSGDRLVWQGEIEYAPYQNDFEKKFLETTRMHYGQLAQHWLSSLSCSEYLQQAKRVLDEEESRAETVLDQTTKPKLLGILEEEVIRKNA